MIKSYGQSKGVLYSLTSILPLSYERTVFILFIGIGSHQFSIFLEIICNVATFIIYSSKLSVNVQVFLDVKSYHWVKQFSCVEWVL